MEQTKKPWQSKTVFFGALTAILSGMSVFMPGAHVVADFLSAHAAEIGMVWGVLAIVLRTVNSNIVLGD